MRDINRIDKFCDELKEVWKSNCPDWRFMQLVDNFQRCINNDGFYLEEERTMELLKKMFEPQKKEGEEDTDFYN